MTTEPTPPRQTFQERQTAAALDLVRARSATYRKVEKILRLDSFRDGHLGATFLELPGDSYVVEVEGGVFTSPDRTSTFRVIVNGSTTSEVYLSLDIAMLAYIEIHSTGAQRGGCFFTARALGVPTED